MLSTEKTRHKTKSSTSPAGTLTLNHLKIIGKAHRLKVLQALAQSEEGLGYKALQYDVVRSSGTNHILAELTNAGLVRKASGRYEITEAGHRAVEHAEAIEALSPTEKKGRGSP